MRAGFYNQPLWIKTTGQNLLIVCNHDLIRIMIIKKYI